MPLPDVTAVLLSLGEPYSARAVASVGRQSPAAIVEIRGVTPFHRALNEGAGRVRTPFFVQLDADMVLDPTALADLRAGVADRVGVVLGLLRDPLLGRIGAVKLFRTACFADARFPDSISPDTDFYHAIARRDWRSVYAVRPETAHTFGAHEPDYTALYTYRKFLLQGARQRYRRAGPAIRAFCRRLRESRHPTAAWALIGTARGIFLTDSRDQLEPYAATPDFERLAAFLAAAGAGGTVPDALRDVAALGLEGAWRLGCRIGADLSHQGAAGDCLAALHHLVDREHALAWVAMVGVCRGLLADPGDPLPVERDLALLDPLLPRPYRRG